MCDGCEIVFERVKDLRQRSANAIVVPFTEQLRINSQAYEYKTLLKSSGDELRHAISQYKAEHFRLKTGLSTTFPAGALNFSKIIAASCPISPHRKNPTPTEILLLKKAITSTLDKILDHDLKSTIIPSFSTSVSKIPSKTYLETLLSTLSQYINQNSEDFTNKKIIISLTKEEQQIFKNYIKKGQISVAEPEQDFSVRIGNSD